MTTNATHRTIIIIVVASAANIITTNGVTSSSSSSSTATTITTIRIVITFAAILSEAQSSFALPGPQRPQSSSSALYAPKQRLRPEVGGFCFGF